MRSVGLRRRQPRTARSRAGLAARVVWRTLAVATAASAAALILLHLSIFWDQLASGRLVDPLVALKWVGSGALCAALILLRRSGVPLFWGRKAFVVWLLVALLHVGTAGPAQADAAADPHAGAVFVLPALLSSLTLVAAGLLLVSRLRRAAPALRRTWHDADVVPARELSAACCGPLAPRAPPLAL